MLQPGECYLNQLTISFYIFMFSHITAYYLLDRDIQKGILQHITLFLKLDYSFFTKLKLLADAFNLELQFKKSMCCFYQQSQKT